MGLCNFTVLHAVRHLLKSSSCNSNTIISLDPIGNRLPGVEYKPTPFNVLYQLCPSLTIHAGCPNAIAATDKAFHKVTIRGMQNQLQVALEASLVRAFIFTLTATMAAGARRVDPDDDNCGCVRLYEPPSCQNETWADQPLLNEN